ncbi:MAG: AAC(3) family N-acetyltransferase [Fimbriimonas sp.]
MSFGELVQALTLLGLGPGDDVLAHTSLSAIGWVDDGAEGLVAALVEAVSPGGTVLFPALTGSAADTVLNPPRADFREPPARFVGKVPAAAWAHPDAVRSVHPTHSVLAIGARAEAWTEGHHRSPTPCGVGSPYHRLALAGGRILLLGCDHNRNTSLHMAEEIAEVPDHLQFGEAAGLVVVPDGREYVIATPLHNAGMRRKFERMDRVLDAAGAQRRGTVGKADCRLVDAEAQLRLAVALLRENPRSLAK